MATDKPPVWIFNASAPDKRGLLEAFGTNATTGAETFISFSGVERMIRIVRATGDDAKPFEDIPLPGATITLALGPLATEPTGGNSNGTYNGVATGLSPLPAGATALQMQTLLNASPAIAAEGGVTVSKGKTGYRVEWVNVGGPRLTLEWFAGSLTPAARVGVETLVIGTAGKREVKLVKIKQDYWGGGDIWAETAAGAVTYSENTAGGPGIREIAQIVITGVPTSGQFKVTAPQLAVTAINCAENSGGNYAVYEVNFNANTIATGNYFDIYDAAGPVRVWFRIAGAGAAPAVPAGGRLKQIDSPGINPDDLGINFWNAFTADSGFTQEGATFGYTVVKIRNIVLGKYPVPVNPGFLSLTFTQGGLGRLDGTYFTIYDKGGAVGVWFNLSPLFVPPVPPALATVSRVIPVTGIAGNATADAVATAVAAAITAAGGLTAAAAANKVTVTDTVGGARPAPVAGTAPVGLTQEVAGYNISATLPYDASAGMLRDALGGIADVTKTVTPSTITYLVSYTAAGAQANLVVANVNLGFSTYYKGKFTLNTDTMLAAFADTTADQLSGVLQGQYAFAGEDPVTFYYDRVTVLRSLLDSSGSNPLNVLGSDYRAGSQPVAAGAFFVDVVFALPLANAGYIVVAGYLESTDAVPASIVPTTVYNKTVNGYRQSLTGGPPTANFIYRYLVKP